MLSWVQFGQYPPTFFVHNDFVQKLCVWDEHCKMEAISKAVNKVQHVLIEERARFLQMENSILYLESKIYFCFWFIYWIIFFQLSIFQQPFYCPALSKCRKSRCHFFKHPDKTFPEFHPIKVMYIRMFPQCKVCSSNLVVIPGISNFG